MKDERIIFHIENIEACAREVLNSSDIDKLKFYSYLALGSAAQALDLIAKLLGESEGENNDE